MYSEEIEKIRAIVPDSVLAGLSEYEKNNEKIYVDVVREKVKEVLDLIFLEVLEVVSSGGLVSSTPFRNLILEGVITLEFDNQKFKNIFSSVYVKIKSHIVENYSYYSAGFEQLIDSLANEIEDSIVEYKGLFLSETSLDILYSIDDYQYSSDIYAFRPKQIDNGSIYTLFNKEKFWEVFKDIPSDQLGNYLYSRDSSLTNDIRENTIVKDGKVYVLDFNVELPTREQFVNSEWNEFSSKKLDKNKKIKTVLREKVRQFYFEFVNNAQSINEIISDSKVNSYAESPPIDEENLDATFGGEGKKIYRSIQELKAACDYFGGYEGSPVGSIEYLARYIEYFYAAIYGRSSADIFDIVSNQVSFGNFSLIFASKIETNLIPGLKFLRGFGRLKSLIHGYDVGAESIAPQSRRGISVSLNPIYHLFKSGVKDRFIITEFTNTYSKPLNFDLLLLTIEKLYEKCLGVGDGVNSLINSVDSDGRLRGYEGFGSIEVQLLELQRAFPPRSYLSRLPPGASGGMSGTIKFLLESYSRFSKAVVVPELPGGSLESFISWISLVQNKVENLVQTIEKLFIEGGAYISNISYKVYNANTDKFITFFRNLGFRDAEINEFLGLQSFKDLVEKFAPVSTSQDLKSFFRAYELYQLLAEFGGEEAIDAYLSFLYRSSDIGSLLNILDIANTKKSNAGYARLGQYPRLIGLLIGLTYAIDPNQLVKFNRLLQFNNLNVLESIQYLLDSGEENIIKSREEIDMIAPLAEQMIQGWYANPLASQSLTYNQANDIVPIALKQWTELIGDNLGNVDSSKILYRLYDKSIGLTPRELISILNVKDSITDLGQLVDGFFGGEFTSLIKYANVVGLGVKLGYYKNSNQGNNFLITPTEYSLPPVFINLMRELINDVDIVKSTFESELDFKFILKDNAPGIVEPIVNSQNKKLDILSKITSSVAPLNGGSIGDLDLVENIAQYLPDISSTEYILESPGVGNSRIPNRVPVLNSITPEQAQLLVGNVSIPSDLKINGSVEQTNLINKFIRFSSENKLVNGINHTDEVPSFYAKADTSKLIPEDRTTGYESKERLSSVPDSDYSVEDIYIELSGGKRPKRSAALGVNYFSPDELSELNRVDPGSLVEGFTPIQSCRKFGGDINDCNERYENSQDRCVDPLNKSLFPETLSSVPQVETQSTPIDRPLGSFSEFKPNNLPLSTSNKSPSYFSLFPTLPKKGIGDEPITAQMSSPLVLGNGGGNLAEYYNSEYGLTEFLRARLEKSTEFSCASFNSPFEYQACMNLMKCKRFKYEEEDSFSLSFCPRTLAGGRFKK